MPTFTNEQRAEFAAQGLDVYAIEKEGRADYDAPETIAADMICDLLHLIAAHDPEGGVNRYLAQALGNYEAESGQMLEIVF